MSDETSYALLSKTVTVGASGVVGITAVAGQCSVSLQYISGGSIWIGGATLAFGVGAQWDANQVASQNFNNYSGNVYLACGITSVFAVIFNLRDGFQP